MRSEVKPASCNLCAPLGVDEWGHPVLPAYWNGRSQLSVWCIYCLDWHVHGAGEDPVGDTKGGDGTRVPHCIERTPYRLDADIYEIRRVGNLTPEVKRNHRRGKPCSGCMVAVA